MAERSRIFQCIDLDRTLFDTSQFVKALTDEVDAIDPGVGTALDERYERDYKSETTFFLLRTLREERGDSWFEATVRRVVRRIGGSALLLDDSNERITQADSLTSLRPSWGILTYGDAIDQQMKARIVGLGSAPFLLTGSPSKGALIASWQQPDGTFQLPEAYGGQYADAVTLEDDKLRAFYGLPDTAFGFWITHDPDAEAKLEAAQREHKVGRITIIRSLTETADYISKITTLSD